MTCEKSDVPVGKPLSSVCAKCQYRLGVYACHGCKIFTGKWAIYQECDKCHQATPPVSQRERD